MAGPVAVQEVVLNEQIFCRAQLWAAGAKCVSFGSRSGVQKPHVQVCPGFVETWSVDFEYICSGLPGLVNIYE